MEKAINTIKPEKQRGRIGFTPENVKQIGEKKLDMLVEQLNP